jgi:hypothetical protein
MMSDGHGTNGRHTDGSASQNRQNSEGKLRGLNTTCFVCGHDYDDPRHVLYCVNSPQLQEVGK